MFGKWSYRATDKAKWLKVLTAEMMSSDESEDDKLIVRPLPWRSGKVLHFFQALDEHVQLHAEKSSPGKRQMKERIVGEPSFHPKPGTGVPSWALEKDPHA